MAFEPDWRQRELSRKQVEEKYPEFPKLLILKIDATRRGIKYTDRALAFVDPDFHHVEPSSYVTDSATRDRDAPVGVTLRDGTVICQTDKAVTKHTKREPYTLDIADGIPVLIDEGEEIEAIEFWEKPHFYDKVTSNGTPMRQIASARPQRICVVPNTICGFWTNPGQGCKFCSIFSDNYGKAPGERDESWFQDIFETVEEALKQKGRYSSFMMTSGSYLSGDEILDDEVDLYIRTLQAAGKAIGKEKFTVKLVATAFSKKQLQRLYDNTGITTYTTDIEVLNKDLFEWICPGKAKYIGYDEWKNRLYNAVNIFGRSNVNTGFVGGIELAQPNGFQSEDEALASTLAEADEIGSHGVSFAETVWNANPHSVFFAQREPSLEYYVRLAQGLADVRRKYGLNIYTDDYRRCGNHPNTDLARID